MSEKKGQINLSIDKELLKDFKIECIKLGIKPSDYISSNIVYFLFSNDEERKIVSDIIRDVVKRYSKKANPSSDGKANLEKSNKWKSILIYFHH